MARHVTLVGTLTIPNGTKPSNVLSIPEGIMALGWIFVNPAAFTGTVSVVGAMDNSTSTPQALDYNGTALVLTAGRIQLLLGPGVRRIGVNSGSNEGADRVIQVYAAMDIGA